MRCPSCGKYYSHFSEVNEVMILNQFKQFLCTQCYTPLNKGIRPNKRDSGDDLHDNIA